MHEMRQKTRFGKHLPRSAARGAQMREIATNLHVRLLERFRALKEQVFHDVSSKMHVF